MTIILNGTTGITTPDIDSTGGLDAADLTGALPAIDGSALTGSPTFGTVTATSLVVNGNNYPSAGSLGNRNLIINGAMQVAQRGTSFTVTSDTYTLDRWAAREGTISQSTDVPANEGFKYSLFYDNDGTRADINVRQKIESGKALLENRQVTVSFWAKASVGTTISLDWTDTNTSAVAVTTSWERYVVTFPASTINPSSIFVGSAWIDFNFLGDHPDIYITGVQLEVGDTATPFEHRSYGQELALCQRYFQPFGAGAVGAEESASQASFGITFAAPMRTNPTNTLRQAGISVRIPSIPTDRTMTSTINGATVIGPSGGWLYLNISGGVAGRTIIERVGATIGFADAEL